MVKSPYVSSYVGLNKEKKFRKSFTHHLGNYPVFIIEQINVLALINDSNAATRIEHDYLTSLLNPLNKRKKKSCDLKLYNRHLNVFELQEEQSYPLIWIRGYPIILGMAG